MKHNRELFKLSMLLTGEVIAQTVEGINNGTITSIPSLPKAPLSKLVSQYSLNQNVSIYLA